ncbi:MAG: response regulator [Candidatus Hodarchaeales archaeon]|jgi:response regulator RpfG family c-di-GMP phosphodiesterase
MKNLRQTQTAITNKLSKVKILIIDDDRFWLKTLTKFVESIYELDIDIYNGINGEDGLKIIDEHPIEVIICDYDLPDMNGAEVLERIHKINPKILRILVSGYEKNKIESFEKARIHYFLQKPPNPEEIQEIIYQEVVKKRKRSS